MNCCKLVGLMSAGWIIESLIRVNPEAHHKTFDDLGRWALVPLLGKKQMSNETRKPLK